MNVCRDNRCDGSHSVDKGLHIKDKKILGLSSQPSYLVINCAYTLFFIRLKVEQCMHLPLLYHRCVRKHICKISIYHSFWESDLFIPFLTLLRCKVGRLLYLCIVTLFLFVPIHFKLREKGPFFKKRNVNCSFQRKLCFFYIDFNFTLTFNLFFFFCLYYHIGL